MTGKNITNQTKINPAGDNYVAVLLEDMHDSIKILAEGQGAIIERIDSLEARLDRMEQDMDSKFQIVMDFLYRIEAEIVDIKAQLAKLDRDKVSRKDFEDYVRRLEKIEAWVARQEERILAEMNGK